MASEKPPAKGCASVSQDAECVSDDVTRTLRKPLLPHKRKSPSHPSGGGCISGQKTLFINYPQGLVSIVGADHFRAVIGGQPILSGSEANNKISMVNARDEVISLVNKGDQVLACEVATWVTAFAEVDLDGLYQIWRLPPFAYLTPRSEQLLKGLDVVLVADSWSRTNARFAHHIEPFLAKALEEGWRLKRVDRFGEIYYKPKLRRGWTCRRQQVFTMSQRLNEEKLADMTQGEKLLGGTQVLPEDLDSYGRVVHQCRICKGTNLNKYLDLRTIPLSNNYVSAQQAPEKDLAFPLEILFCNDCRLSQLSVVIKPEILYKRYFYRSSISQTFIDHCYQFAREAVRRFQLTELDLVVDIASNDGATLGEFKKFGVSVLGVDPAENLAEISRSKGVPVVVDFWNKDTAQRIRDEYGEASMINAMNVVAHVDDLDSFMEGVNILLNSTGVFAMEVPYLLNFINKNEFDTTYHEHLSYFLIHPLQRLFKKHNLEIFDIYKSVIHGGSIRVYVKKVENGKIPVSHESIQWLLELENDLGLLDLNTYLLFSNDVLKMKRDLIELVTRLKKRGKTIAAYGASAKGNVLTNYCELGNDEISYIVDDTPEKQGYLTPGNRIPIVASTHLEQDPPDCLLLLAWNFAEELMAKTKEYSDNGGQYIIPIPSVQFISGGLSNKAIPQRPIIFAVFIAYNAAKTLEDFYKAFPKNLVDQIILVDDASSDGTYDLARSLGIPCYRNETNLGYGGNIKRAINLALDQGADIIIDLHPDGEYKPSGIEPALKQILMGQSELVLGNRFSSIKKAIGSGMYIWKLPVILLLNLIPRFILRLGIKDYHQGFRVYTKKLLQRINFQENSNDFLFSFELIAQAASADGNVTEVPVENAYTGAKRGATLNHSVNYTIGVFKVILMFLLSKFGFKIQMFARPLEKLQPPNEV